MVFMKVNLKFTFAIGNSVSVVPAPSALLRAIRCGTHRGEPAKVPLRYRRAAIVSLCVLLSGCQTWHREPIHSLRPGTRVQLWSGGKVKEVHGVRVVGDSLAVVPLGLSPTCEGCGYGIRVPLSSIDSMRARYASHSRNLLLVGGAIALVGIVGYVSLITPSTCRFPGSCTY